VAISPETRLELGAYLVDLDHEDEAAATYENAIREVRDRVAVSNHLKWLVGYHCDHGRTARAREVAGIAAETGSGGGMSALGYFFERMGQFEEAEKAYQSLVDRYDDRRALDEFYVRYQQRFGGERFRSEAEAALSRLFPKGLERVSLADLTTPPGEAGVRISGRYHRSTRFGLLKDDLLVALNGYRVRNDPQYQCLWSFTDEPEAIAIVWRAGRYQEIKGRLPRMRYAPTSGAPTREPPRRR
jgi:tetratricopeptide (TPR) repeat protein